MAPVRVVGSVVTGNVTLVTTAETVVATLGPVNTRQASEPVVVEADVQVTAGTGATAITPRVRRGTAITDPLVGEGNPITVAAGNTVTVGIRVVDQPGEVAGQSYVVTLQQTAATGNGTTLQTGASVTVGK